MTDHIDTQAIPETFTLIDQLHYLWDLRERCREGIPTQKAIGKEAKTVIEAHPALEVQTTKAMVDIIQMLEDQGSKEPMRLEITISEAVDIP
jgi:hypothetical protein